MSDEEVTILASEYDRLLKIEIDVRVEKEVAEAWGIATKGAIKDLIEMRDSNKLRNADISVEIIAGKPGYKTYITTGLKKEKDVDYLIERIGQRHAELEAEIIDNAYTSWE